MSLSSQKSGQNFLKLTDPKFNGKAGQLSPEAWAQIMLIAGFPADPKVIAEGLGTIEAESGFDASSKPPGNSHIGAWAEEPGMGSEADRLNPYKATIAARKRWQADGKTFYNAWTRWEIEQSGVNGAANGVKKYHSLAKQVIEKSKGGGGFDPLGAIGGVIGDVTGAAGDVVGGITSAEDFLVELAKTLLDFKRLGQLAVEAFSWFLRLLAKAIWDYVIAPLLHWSERAVSFYWTNFFSTGTEQGSGFGYQLRQNAGIITIVFWSVGYAILWTDGTSLSPADASGSVLGQGVKKIEGAIARRHLVKPQDVEDKTPTKPDPKTSTVTIERTQSFSVSRARPVKVASSGGEHTTGRKENERSEKPQTGRVPRPSEVQKTPPEQTIIVPPGKAKPTKAQKPAKPSGPRKGSRSNSENGSKDLAAVG